MSPNIYNFRDPVAFLEACYQSKKLNQLEFSVRKWAAELNINNPQFFMDVLKRKKKLTLPFALTISQGLALDLSEAQYFEVLTKFELSENLHEKKILELVLAEICHLKGSKIQIEDQSIFSHWVHMAILTMTKIKGFRCNRNNIRDFLKDDVSQAKIDEAIERLLLLGLIQYEGEVLLRNYDHNTSKNDAFKISPHRYFEQVSELAKRGAKLRADEREYQCFSMAIDPSKMPLFKEAFRNFRAKMHEISGENNLSQVFQVNLQFFPLTEVAPVIDVDFSIDSKVEIPREF